MSEDGHPVGESEHAPLPLSFLQSAVRSLAALQISTMARQREFFQAGVSDHTSNVLAAHGRELFDFLEMAMALQTSVRVPRVDVSRLREILEILGRVSDYAARMPIPDSVLHGDLNLGNILQCASHCQFIDWSDAFFGNPLITFEHLLLLNRTASPDELRHRERSLRDLYVSTMSTVCDPERIRKAFALSPLLAAASTLYGRGKWLSTPERNDPRRQAFGRTLARHMDRAANDPRLLAQIAS
ncbi:phosphotransferase [Granulicella paludicola]|uniref:phosphotransferase n=1 Tax=Granulicella paludicola TaxID=474951 RepID=UPI0037C0B0DB